jgi:signal transduction histidine kinase
MLNTGFGIGLSIARQIIEQHGGTIALRNRPQGGALFEISLPHDGGPGR